MRLDFDLRVVSVVAAVVVYRVTATQIQGKPCTCSPFSRLPKLNRKFASTTRRARCAWWQRRRDAHPQNHRSLISQWSSSWVGSSSVVLVFCRVELFVCYLYGIIHQLDCQWREPLEPLMALTRAVGKQVGGWKKICFDFSSA